MNLTPSYVTLSEHKFDTWAFLEPFDNALWLMIIFTVLLVSLFMYISNYVSTLKPATPYTPPVPFFDSPFSNFRQKRGTVSKKAPRQKRQNSCKKEFIKFSLFIIIIITKKIQISPFGYYKQFYKKIPKFTTDSCECVDINKNMQNVIQREFYKINLNQVTNSPHQKVFQGYFLEHSRNEILQLYILKD